MNTPNFDLERFDITIPRDIPFNRHMADHHITLHRKACDHIARLTKGLHAAPVIIDAACGYGNAAAYFCDLGTYMGIDLSQPAIAECHRRHPGLEFRIGDLMDPHVLDGLQPNFIFSCETLEHLPDPGSFLRICHDALERTRKMTGTEGYLICSAPIIRTRDWAPFHLHDYTLTQWRSLLLNAGFRIVEDEAVGFECKIGDFLESGPTGPERKRQARHVVRYILTHPSYWFERLSWWAVRRRFHFICGFFVCRLA